MMCIGTMPRYQGDLRPEIFVNPHEILKMAMAMQLLFVPITAFTKLSILLTYLRIFPSKRNKWFCYSMMAFTGAWAVFAFFLPLFQCKPVEAYWYIAKYPTRPCKNPGPIYYSTGGINTFSDFLVYLWPAKDLSKIHISVRERVMLITMFCIGVIICVAGVIRLWTIEVYLNSYDFLWNGSALFAVVAIENSIGIICGCIPGCKPLLSKLAPRVFASINATTDSQPQSGSRKRAKMRKQSFPFQSLGGGDSTRDEKHNGGGDGGSSSNQYHGERSKTAGTDLSAKSRSANDSTSMKSQDWILMEENILTKSIRSEPSVV